MPIAAVEEHGDPGAGKDRVRSDANLSRHDG
jgi:hypothetical protein